MSRLEPGYLPVSSGVLPAVVMCCRSRRRSQRKRDARTAGAEVAAVPVGGGRVGG